MNLPSAALFFLALAAVSTARPSCPLLPSTCQCEADRSGRFSVTCDGTVLASLFKDLGNLPLERLRVFNCSQPVLDHLPKGPVRAIEISRCRIQSVDAKVFENVTDSLEELILTNNLLTAVPAMGSLSRLLSLNLNRNKISNVSEKSLAGLPSLRQLRLEDNKICSIPPKALDGPKTSLELLDMSGNCLTSLPNLQGSNVVYLDLSQNRISKVEDSELVDMPSLKEVRLGKNGLRQLHPATFAKVPTLQFLNLRDNRLAAFDGRQLNSLPSLSVLDLTNNNLAKAPVIQGHPSLSQVRLDGNWIQKIDRLAFSSSPLLGQLSLRNNSLSALDPFAFFSLSSLSSLDLSHNKLSKLDKRVFANISQLQWLNLAENNLRGFEKETFSRKIANILLSGNEWECDEKFDWFVAYLVTNQVRTFVPGQAEISCEGPAKYAGVRLRDVLVKKANDTISEGMKTLGLGDQGSQKSLISSFIPGFDNLQSTVNGQTLGNMAAGIPILHTVTQAIPSLRSLPGLNIPAGTGAKNLPENRDLNQAIEQFTAPLVRFATGGQPVASDITQLIQSIPNFIVNVPGAGDIDISKVDPAVVEHVLKGGQIPGITKETLDGFLKQYMGNVYAAALAAQKGNMTDEQAKFLPPMDKLPSAFVTNVIKGDPLPFLDANQTAIISSYYTKTISLGSGTSASASDLLSLMPPGYNMSLIPSEVINAVASGKLPDLKLLPADLLSHFLANADKLTGLLTKMAPADSTIKDVLSNLPKFNKPVLATFSPYDINQLSSEMIHEEEKRIKAEKMKFYTIIVLGVVGVLTLAIVVFFVVYLRKQRRNKTRVSDATSIASNNPLTPGPPLASSTMRSPKTPGAPRHNRTRRSGRGNRSPRV